MTEVYVPDLGGADSATVIEVLVKPGDQVELDQPIATLEGEKATMEIPATKAGVVEACHIQVGDVIKVGQPMITLAASADHESAPIQAESPAEPQSNETEDKTTGTTESMVLSVPDLGGAAEAKVIECLVKVGDEIKQDQPLCTLEGEKATMEVPATHAGKVEVLHIEVGQSVAVGAAIVTIETTVVKASKKTKAKAPASNQAPAAQAPQHATPPSAPVTTHSANVYAGPSVRRYAREFGLDLGLIQGTGHKGRIQKEDLIAYVKHRLQQPATGGAGIPQIPQVDFSQFGPTTEEPLSKIKQATAKNMVRNWLNIPHVTQFGHADITALDQVFQPLKQAMKAQGRRVTLLPFLMKALVATLKVFPRFNASLHPSGKSLILKDYFHIGIAVDTPDGLVVPVIRDVDKKDILTITEELQAVSEQARTSGLPMKAMQGGSMTISNLGGIGGGTFTPIVNAPEVAILGVSRQIITPIYQDEQWVPQTQLPLSLSYDHRVIDGAEAARFLVKLMHHITHVVVELIAGDK